MFAAPLPTAPSKPRNLLRKPGKRTKKFSTITPENTEIKFAMSKRSVTLTINGARHTVEVEPRLLLVHFLRDVVNLTGTHVGCETSLCGACTVLLRENGAAAKAVKSCTMFAVQADGAEITTIEGLAQNGALHPVQQGFWEKHGLQCGFCTPGMILSAVQLLARNPQPTRADICHVLEGNLCRCTGYSHIIDAVQFAAQELAKAK